MSQWSAADQKVIDDIKEFGWHVPLVGGDPPFAYTVGLFGSFQVPEMVVIGLPLKNAHEICNVYGFAAKDGNPIPAGETDAFFEGRRGYLLEVSWSFYENLGIGLWAYQNYFFPALQLVWADDNNALPWEPHYNEALRAYQPIWNDNGGP